ncbi:MAG: HIT domain-containing protein [Candidatus Omnitrophica bacterium]|nr:HIT domain-containing protein [Candidatus Omnitrophota bacterium]
MDILWAPWRMAYIKQNDKKRECFLCRAIKSRDDKKNFILYRGKNAFVVINIFPYNNGHLMIVPNRHTGSIEGIKKEEERELFFLLKASVKIIKKVIRPTGFNIGINLGEIAGAGVAGHLHFHIVPRWKGDTNFMPVISNSKVICQSLKELYDLLYPEFKELKKCI